MNSINLTVLKNIYNRIFIERPTKLKSFLQMCKNYGIYSPLLKSACRIIKQPIHIFYFLLMNGNGSNLIMDDEKKSMGAVRSGPLY